MEEPEWVNVSELPLIADEQAYYAMQNGSSPEPEEDSWTPRNLAELDDTPPVEPTLGGLSLCYPGKRHVFSGPQESAKTLAAYVIGLSVVRAGSSVVLIDFEMGPWDAKTRLRELGASDEELALFLYVEPERKPSADDLGGLLGAEPSLVILDAGAGAFTVSDLDDNSRRDVERFAAAWITPFWKQGVATIVLDHVTKNVEARGNYAIGSERKVGGADVHLGFSVVHPIKRGGTGLYKVTTHKDRGGFLKRGLLCEFELQSDPGTHRIAWEFKQPPAVDEEHVWRPTHLMEKVSRYLERQLEPVTKNTILELNLGRDEYVRKALEILQDEGYVEESKGANRSLLQLSIVAYREDLDDAVSGTSQVRPGTSQENEDSGVSVRPSPYGGDVPDRPTAGTDSSTSRALFESSDDIPF